ncbi:MAG: tryptophan synthase subunit alpha [Flavobacteriaceae bacterium CG_4_8_14_3_um_filter_34_10]|nr:tryptophan synthase subunit alpha [Flavobacteriia bacterium]OIP51808.1 MAG: tryptophan synthase subunit alpha [Flavobacteriaceae bacterium CG2_30_34_30]PIV49322.1 MAG: tryptophan synthase subunit alpha [Flavobacteriaceae bacterium CG02_land_8_20_14_3_00_34_13]PIX09135.1 MAG: tryptophan synthase subunit alpha [Flavobacteriaceae bacterium CG_4_8_14_3_um_filter_34_10]PIZ06809.1 MAG: tryptophan synthase subunit alpha [Flavobacteriaceae bacterium CG_4_10_14_0_8_um_filter_34_31]PJC05937.1 MAG: tr
MNRIQKKLEEKKKLLSIYFTAGYPTTQDTIPILMALEKSGVDLIEIGLPFSDPLADGTTIQESAATALKNGMATEVIFNQLKDVRKKITVPLLLMGYFNPILQFGVENFCQKCYETGIDGLIIPDLPIQVYEEFYKNTFEKNGLIPIFLITPQTDNERINRIDSISDGFIYMVSNNGTTGAKKTFEKEQSEYFKRIFAMKLKHPQIVGFGISNKDTFYQATKFTSGAIIGSAFIQMLSRDGLGGIDAFIKSIR